jgi:hypothetical protein
LSAIECSSATRTIRVLAMPSVYMPLADAVERGGKKLCAEAPSAAFIIVIADLLPQTHLEPTRTPRAAV